MLRFVETREDAYGVDLDYVLDFLEFCNRGKGIIGHGMAELWIKAYGAVVPVDDLVRATRQFVKERGTRSIKP